MNKHYIRPAAPSDGQMISTLIIRTVCETNASDYSPEVIELICTNFSLENVLRKMQIRDVFVCLDEDHCAGTISLEGNKLHSLFVDPNLQRQNIGKQLVIYLENHALMRGQTELYLSSSITAVPFYERLGYLLIKFEERRNGSTYLMKKQLSNLA